MISFSQISLFSSHARHMSLMDTSQLRVNQSAAASLQKSAEQSTKQVQSVSSSLGVTGSEGQAGAEVVDARVEAIQQALVKLNEIREKQRAFIERARETGDKDSPLKDYFSIIDRLRLELLNSPDKKKQAASRYLEFARG